MPVFTPSKEEMRQSTITQPAAFWDRLTAIARVVSADMGEDVSMARTLRQLVEAGEGVWAKERPDLAAKVPAALEEVRKERREGERKTEKAPRGGKRGGR